MANTTATLIGSYETIRVMEQADVPADRMMCVAGGETIDERTLCHLQLQRHLPPRCDR
jgi:hypothetical protein